MAGRRERQQSGGFAERLRMVVQTYGSASALAKAIERSEGAVRKWLRGESEPNVTDLRSLCEETRTSIEWLVTGLGRREAAPALGVQEAAPPYETTRHTSGQGTGHALDYALLEGVISAVDEGLRQAGLDLPSTKRSMLIVTLYDLSQERKEVDHEAVTRLVKLAG